MMFGYGWVISVPDLGVSGGWIQGKVRGEGSGPSRCHLLAEPRDYIEGGYGNKDP